MGGELRLFFAAWQALTRGPLQGGDRSAERHYAAVGLVVGGFGAVVMWAAAHVWPASVAVGVTLVALCWLTRARHEAGLVRAVQAVAADGSAATVTLVAVLALKGAALHGLAVRDFAAALAVLPLAHALSRAAIVLAQPAEPGVTPAVAIAWCVIAAAVAAVLGLETVPVLCALLAAALATGVLAREAALIAALQPLVETAVLLAALAAVARG